MFRKYYEQGLLDLNDWWWWLITPDAGNSYFVRYVNMDGTLSICDAYFGIRGILKSKSRLKKTKSIFPLPPYWTASQRASLWQNCSGEYARKGMERGCP